MNFKRYIKDAVEQAVQFIFHKTIMSTGTQREEPTDVPVVTVDGDKREAAAQLYTMYIIENFIKPICQDQTQEKEQDDCNVYLAAMQLCIMSLMGNAREL